jgi:hypothetical protein
MYVEFNDTHVKMVVTGANGSISETAMDGGGG